MWQRSINEKQAGLWEMNIYNRNMTITSKRIYLILCCFLKKYKIGNCYYIINPMISYIELRAYHITVIRRSQGTSLR